MNFSFLAPLALLGLAALAIPIYLHLRHRPRAIPISFSAIEFLLAAQKKRRKRLRFEQFLLMLARALILAALAFVFARPVLDSFFPSAPGHRSTPYIVILDDSASMLAGPNHGRFFFEAKSQIADILSRRPTSAPTYILPASNPDAFTDTNESQDLLQFLGSWPPTLRHVTLDAAFEAARGLIGSQEWDRATIHIFTDGSATAWDRRPQPSSENWDVILTSMRRQIRSFSNSGILSVTQPLSDSSAELEVSLFHAASRDSRLDVAILSDDRPYLTHGLNLAPWSKTTHRFDLGDADAAAIEIRLPNDDFDLDNRAFYPPHQRKRLRVLIVDGDTHPNPKESESFFFANALGARDENSAYDCAVIAPAGLPDAELDRFDVVCLLNVAAPPEDQIIQAARSGVGVFISMGNRVDYESWNPILNTFDLEVWETKHLPAPRAVTLKLPSHPIFNQIPQHEWELQLRDTAVQAYRLFGVGRSPFRVPLSLDDGTPLLLSHASQTARMVIWSSSMDLAWSNFPLQFAFLPMIRQSMDFLGGQGSALSITHMTVDEAAQSEIRDLLRLKFAAPVFENLDVDDPVPGIYSLTRNQQSEWVSIRLDEAESDFRPLTQNASADAPTAGTGDQAAFRESIRTELSPAFLWLFFAIVLIETGLAAMVSAKWGGR